MHIPKFDTKELQETAKKPDPNQTNIFERDDLQETDEQFEIRVNSSTSDVKKPKAA